MYRKEINMMKRCMTWVLLLLLIPAALVWASQVRWVNSDETALKAESKVTAATVATLPVGAEVTVLEGAGRWQKVRAAGGAVGWVYAGRLADTKPVAEVAGQDGMLFGTMQQSNIQTAKADSARSIRGLSPETEAYAKERGTPLEYRQALDQILGYRVSKEELTAFLQKGQIGEYAP
jgi:SH3-like domain-containing protein